MARPLILIAKTAGVPVFAGISLWLSGETELFIQLGTVVLAMAAAATLCFAATHRVRVSAAVVLFLVPVCQHAVDFYYWFGVQHHGLPWPWVAAEQGGASSVALQAGQVADVSFCLLVFIVALVAACHLTIRSSGPPTVGPLPQTLGVMKLAAILLTLGAALFGYALTLSPYKNEKRFMERYMSMSDGQSKEYWKLRDEMLTPKFQLEDYGLTIVAIAVAVFLMTRKGYVQFRSPSSRKALIALSLALPLLTVGSYVFDLLQAFNRGEFPHWADSMGIPLMGIPIQFAILLAWSLVHLGFLRGVYYSSAPLAHAVSLKANWWLLFVSAVTAVLVLLCTASGQYWYAVPGVLWLYFYLSLEAVRRAANGT